MDPDFSLDAGEPNFEFAFNSSNFSDRVLRIEILPDPPDLSTDGVDDWARHRKRRREEKGQASEISVSNSEQSVNCIQSDPAGDFAFENHEGETDTMIELPPSGDENSNCSDSSWSADCSSLLSIKSLFISSAILAAKSPFFYKLFSNGMRESEQRHASLRIYASEEAALMKLLSFMYSGKLSNTSPADVLDVLMTADKFEVASCMRYCTQLLRNLPMTTESALLYLELPPTISMASTVQPLTDAAKEFLANKYKDISKFQEEFINLPLSGVEAILSSDDLQVSSEDAVYDLVLKWARAQYPMVEERREILASRLWHLVRFPFMSSKRLRRVLTSSELEYELVSKTVLDALFFKSEYPHRQRILASEESTSRKFVERTYKYRPVKVVEFEVPQPQCVVYLNLKREECANMFPAGRVYSQAFFLGDKGFFLSAHCNMDHQSSFHCFGLFLGMLERGSVCITVDYEFSVRTRPAGEFTSKYKGSYTFVGGKAVGYRNLFAVPWTMFMDDDSLYFINGMLHLRAELTVKQQPQRPLQ